MTLATYLLLFFFRAEEEIQYWCRSKKTDYLATVFTHVLGLFSACWYTRSVIVSRLGVSVTRAMKYRGVYDATDAQIILEKVASRVEIVSSVRSLEWQCDAGTLTACQVHTLQ